MLLFVQLSIVAFSLIALIGFLTFVTASLPLAALLIGMGFVKGMADGFSRQFA